MLRITYSMHVSGTCVKMYQDKILWASVSFQQRLQSEFCSCLIPSETLLLKGIQTSSVGLVCKLIYTSYYPSAGSSEVHGKDSFPGRSECALFILCWLLIYSIRMKVAKD